MTDDKSNLCNELHAMPTLVIFVLSVQVHPDLENTHAGYWCLTSDAQLYLTEAVTINS